LSEFMLSVSRTGLHGLERLADDATGW